MIGIYKIINNINGKCYVGQSVDIERRFQEHIKRIKTKDTVIYKAIKKYGFENFSFCVLEECKECDLDNRERYYIEKEKSYKNGYNMTVGGKGYNGKFCKKHRRSLSESKKGKLNPMYGKKSTPEQNKKRSETFKKTISKMDKERFIDWHKKIGLKHKGKIISQETRNKISESVKRSLQLKKNKLK